MYLAISFIHYVFSFLLQNCHFSQFQENHHCVPVQRAAASWCTHNKFQGCKGKIIINHLKRLFWQILEFYSRLVRMIIIHVLGFLPTRSFLASGKQDLFAIGVSTARYDCSLCDLNIAFWLYFSESFTRRLSGYHEQCWWFDFKTDPVKICTVLTLSNGNSPNGTTLQLTML